MIVMRNCRKSEPSRKIVNQTNPEDPFIRIESEYYRNCTKN